MSVPTEQNQTYALLNKDYIHLIHKHIQEKENDVIKRLILDLHPADIADLLEYFERPLQAQLINIIKEDLTGHIIIELDPRVKDYILSLLNPNEIASIINGLNTSDTVYILENIHPDKLTDILSFISGLDRIAIERAFEYPENSVARIMQRDFISMPCSWDVQKALSFFKLNDHLPKKFYDIYITDNDHKLLGLISLYDLLKAQSENLLKDVCNKDCHPVFVDDTKEEVAYLFEHYHLNSIPVIGRAERVIGSILIDDAVDVLQTEVEEDIKQLAGVGGEEITDTIKDVVVNRGYWLLVNLMTAILAAIIISFFSQTIEQYVVLAAMAPLVASMGGNAASQTLTVIVRALATRDLNDTNQIKTLKKEFKIGLINGTIFAIICAIIVTLGAYGGLWVFDYTLCIIMMIAMFLAMVSAAMSGILIPLVLKKFNIDPAISAVVFVTTVTDVVGFFSVLGLGYWLLY